MERRISSFKFGPDKFFVEMDEQDRAIFYLEEGKEKIPLFRVNAQSLLRAAAEAIFYVGFGMDHMAENLKEDGKYKDLVM